MSGEDDRDPGDPACWLDQVCEVCGAIPDPPATVDEQGRCPSCRPPHRLH